MIQLSALMLIPRGEPYQVPWAGATPVGETHPWAEGGISLGTGEPPVGWRVSGRGSTRGLEGPLEHGATPELKASLVTKRVKT